MSVQSGLGMVLLMEAYIEIRRLGLCQTKFVEVCTERHESRLNPIGRCPDIFVLRFPLKLNLWFEGRRHFGSHDSVLLSVQGTSWKEKFSFFFLLL